MSKRPAIIVDMDGTLADVSGIRHHVRRPARDFDTFHRLSVDVPVNHEVRKIVRKAWDAGFDVLIVTARREKWRHQTAWFLALHNIPSTALIMRGDHDGRPDVEVKRDMLHQFILPAWNPTLAVDDNPSVIAMWEAEGIPTEVIPGWED